MELAEYDAVSDESAELREIVYSLAQVQLLLPVRNLFDEEFGTTNDDRLTEESETESE